MTMNAHADEVPGHPGAGAHDAPDDHGDDHAHGGESLGPIDVRAWGAGLIGVALGLVIAAAFVLATQPA